MARNVLSPRRLGRTLATVVTVAVAGLALGVGTASAAPLPTAPTALDAYQSDAGEATVTWDFPTDEGDTPVVSFRVTLGTLPAQTVDANQNLEKVFTGLAVGTYPVSVVATNDAGDSAPATGSVEIGNLPSAPRNFVAKQTGPRQVTITFDAPADQGSSAIVNYGIGYGTGQSGDGSEDYPASTRSHVFDDLAPGDYTFVAYAINSFGGGADAGQALTVVAPKAAAPAAPKAAAPKAAAPKAVAPKVAVAATQLPRTGSGTTVLGLAGVSLLVLGAAMTVGGRRRETV